MLSLFATLRFKAYGDRYAPRLAYAPARSATGPNIVLFTLDTLRADFVGCYGRRKIETPALDALAADGVLFEYAIAQAPHTTPSHCSIMTSRYPGDHGALNGVAMRPDLPDDRRAARQPRIPDGRLRILYDHALDGLGVAPWVRAVSRFPGVLEHAVRSRRMATVGHFADLGSVCGRHLHRRRRGQRPGPGLAARSARRTVLYLAPLFRSPRSLRGQG
ncbi:MAG: sulfatase-like hydrolase/transferase, partial [Planctomycetes bacterium]|nr:sulfatase-like hydrolase/transferase [Planctomycetota bacterium]